MNQELPITFLAIFGIMASIPATATAESASHTRGAPIVLAERSAPAGRHARMRNSLAAIPARTGARSSPAGNNAVAATPADFDVDSLISTSLLNTGTSGPKKRNLEFSGRTGPKLRIGLRQKKVRFALNFELVDDVFFAPAYRLAISRADFQNPDGYWAHSVFFGMRFKFESGAQ